MREAEYLCVATQLGLSRRDAMLMEIATVHAMAEVRSKAMRESSKGKGVNSLVN